MKRDPAGRFGQAHRVRLAAAIRECLRRDPAATLAAICKATGASHHFATQVRQKMRAEAQRRRDLSHVGPTP